MAGIRIEAGEIVGGWHEIVFLFGVMSDTDDEREKDRTEDRIFEMFGDIRDNYDRVDDVLNEWLDKCVGLDGRKGTYGGLFGEMKEMLSVIEKANEELWGWIEDSVEYGWPLTARTMKGGVERAEDMERVAKDLEDAVKALWDSANKSF